MNILKTHADSLLKSGTVPQHPAVGHTRLEDVLFKLIEMQNYAVSIANIQQEHVQKIIGILPMKEANKGNLPASESFLSRIEDVIAELVLSLDRINEYTHHLKEAL